MIKYCLILNYFVLFFIYYFLWFMSMIYIMYIMCIIYIIMYICILYIMYTMYIVYIRRKFRSQTSDNMDRWKAEQGRGREKGKIRREKIRRERVRRKKMQMRVAKHCVFPMICFSGGSKSRLAKAAGAEPAGQMRDENLHAVVAFKMCFAPQRRALFRHLKFQKWSEAGVLCTFWLQNVLRATTACTFSTSQLPKVVREWCALYILTSKCASRHNGVHFFDISTSKSRPTLRCFAHFDFQMCFAPQRRALFRHLNFQKWSENGVLCTFWAKHILKSKCAKHLSVGRLLEVEMSKKCTPLWREAHFEVKMYKAHHSRTTFGSWDVEKVHAVVARSTFGSQNVQSTTCSRHFWRFGCWKSARRCGAKHISKSKCTKHHMFAPLLEVRMSLRFTTLHYTTLHDTTFHYTSLHYTTLHSTTLQLQLRLHNYTPLHEITLHYTPLHYNYNYDYTTTLHYTKLHYTTLHYTTLHYIPLHSTTLHYITLHYNTLNDTAPQIDR